MKHWMYAAAALCAFGAAAEELSLMEEVEKSYTRSYTVESEMELSSFSMIVDGEEMPDMGEMEQTDSTSFELVVTDTVRRAKDGRATVWAREYDEIGAQSAMSMSMPMMGSEEHEDEQESPLEGETVIFSLDGDEATAAYPEGAEGDEEWLEGLEGRLDLAFLLPEEAVEKGDKWQVEPALLARLRRPGGDLHLESTSDAGMPGPFPGKEQEPEFGGEFTIEYGGQREEQGRMVAVLKLAVDAGSQLDLTDEMQAMEAEGPDDLPEGAMMPELESFLVEQDFLGEGAALWDLEAGRLVALQLDLEVSQRQTVQLLMGEQEAEQIMVMEGAERIEATCEVR